MNNLEIIELKAKDMGMTIEDYIEWLLGFVLTNNHHAKTLKLIKGTKYNNFFINLLDKKDVKIKKAINILINN